MSLGKHLAVLEYEVPEHRVAARTHAIMSHLTLPRRPQHSPSASSTARAAAEAAFTDPRDEADVAVVVIKRRRPVVGTIAAVPDVTPNAPANNAREQRVFRVERSRPAGQPSAETGVADAAASLAASAEALDGPLESTPPIPHRRSRRKHGAVIVIRPERLADQELGSGDSRESPTSKPQATSLARDFAFQASLDRERFETLRAQIVKLEREAEKLRAQEAAKAVRWIRRAIEDYALTAEDLGFKQQRRTSSSSSKPFTHRHSAHRLAGSF